MKEIIPVICGVGNQIKGNISKLSIFFININFDYYESETEANGQSQWIIPRSKAKHSEWAKRIRSDYCWGQAILKGATVISLADYYFKLLFHIDNFQTFAVHTFILI